MKVGDLVKLKTLSTALGTDVVGILVENVRHNKGIGCTNKVFKVLWHDGTIGNNVWDYDLKVINESR